MGLGRKGKWEREGKHNWLKSLYAPAQGRSRDLSRGRTFAEQPCLRHTSQPSTASKRCVSITAFTAAADRLLADHPQQRARWHLLGLLEAHHARQKLQLLLVVGREGPTWNATSVGNGAHTRGT